MDIARQRLYNQHLSGDLLPGAPDVVGWLGAVQAQDYPAAKWGVAQRARTVRQTDVDRALTEGAILRTHVMRPTWHFVLPADLRGLLALTAPRVHALNATYYRRSGLDDDTLRRGHRALVAALQGAQHKTRAELGVVFRQADLPTSGLPFLYLLMHAELAGLICSGALRGKQQTYALLDERVPPAAPLTRDEVLAELARRYFTGHGPAQIHDLAWWSGLTVADARLGVELAASHLVQETVDGKAYWFNPAMRPVDTRTVPVVHLLPVYDELLVAYKDRSPAFDPDSLKPLPSPNAALDGHIVVMDGRVVGGWRRTVKRQRVTVETALLVDMNDAERDALKAAAEGYGRFMDMPVELVVG